MKVGFHYQGLYTIAFIEKGKIKKITVDDIAIEADFKINRIIKEKLNELNN